MKTTNRRNFVKGSLTLATGLLLTSKTFAGSILGLRGKNKFRFELSKLTYSFSGLEPVIDAATMQIHYERHYGTYVKNANEAIMEENISAGNAKDLFSVISNYSTKLRNNAGGAFNHELFWSILRKPTQNNAPTGALAQAIDSSFGSFESFKEEFSKAAMGQFGSGWAWLVKDGNQLKIGGTPNQENPLMDLSPFKGTPILGLDVWEHAYYLNYQNKRADYIHKWWEVVNWEQVSQYHVRVG
ncbi:superoxide dismutase [Sphingobacterium phlebotomi]|uniref:Superoxide dismutase n=1 Tax=Sphingobacterium phlebotomi TaxID=2605433 RepID=A0A5D4GTP9_9SPHI|nr:superoxide dismutase [Sphingobacterium phlebotomi]TYR31708.1 superoxide dismutase [Sphingobacterium phlebotomi]